MSRPGRVAAALLLPALWGGATASAAAQGAAEAAVSAASDTAGSRGEERPMARAPADFAVAASVARASWKPRRGASTVEDGLLAGGDLESRASRFLAFRLLFAYGSTRIAGPDGSASTRQYLAELSVVGRAAFGSLRRIGVVPFVDAGAGTLVHDPAAEELITRSQTVLSWGGGLDVALGADSPFGVRVEWRRAEVQMENLFVPRDREAVERAVDRVMGGFYLRL